MAVLMRLVISIKPTDFIFGARKAFLCRRLEALKGAATREKQKPQLNARPTIAVISGNYQ